MRPHRLFRHLDRYGPPHLAEVVGGLRFSYTVQILFSLVGALQEKRFSP